MYCTLIRVYVTPLFVLLSRILLQIISLTTLRLTAIFLNKKCRELFNNTTNTMLLFNPPPAGEGPNQVYLSLFSVYGQSNVNKGVLFHICLPPNPFKPGKNCIIDAFFHSTCRHEHGGLETA